MNDSSISHVVVACHCDWPVFDTAMLEVHSAPERQST
jgi:hypothetical protein